MSARHTLMLNRQSYIDSTAKIEDTKTLRFAKMSLEWWDRHFSWKQHGCMVLADQEGEHLCYIFYKIDRYHHYMTIHNIFTPLVQRHKGYATELLGTVFDIALVQQVQRFKLVCVSKSLDFYLSLGFIYWGMNSVGDYYCDLPLPSQGLCGLAQMTQTPDIGILVGSQLQSIIDKVKDNELGLTPEHTLRYEQDKAKLRDNYRLSSLREYHQDKHKD